MCGRSQQPNMRLSAQGHSLKAQSQTGHLVNTQVKHIASKWHSNMKMSCSLGDHLKKWGGLCIAHVI